MGQKWTLWMLLLCLVCIQAAHLAMGKAVAHPGDVQDEDGDDDDEDSDDDGFEEDENMIDLTHPFGKDTICYPGAREFKWRVAFNETSDAGFWLYMDEIEGSVHCGTHMDAPCHVMPGKWCMHDIPTARLISPAVLIDIKDNGKDDTPPVLTPDHLEDFVKEHGKIPDGAVLLINSGNHKNWPDRLKYSGTATLDDRLLKIPTVSVSAARWIADRTKVVGVGIDSFSVDVGRKADVHQILMKKNIYILENVGNLDNLAEALKKKQNPEIKLFTIPMRIKEGSGAPCRILAALKEKKQHNHRGSPSRIKGHRPSPSC